jgi:hypothetical protein
MIKLEDSGEVFLLVALPIREFLGKGLQVHYISTTTSQNGTGPTLQTLPSLRIKCFDTQVAKHVPFHS